MAYARGDLARAMCPVCGNVIPYMDLRRDWRGQFVCYDCDDEKPPQLLRVAPPADAQELHHPRPFLDKYPSPTVPDMTSNNLGDPPNFFIYPSIDLPYVLDGGPPGPPGIILDGGSPGSSGTALDGGPADQDD